MRNINRRWQDGSRSARPLWVRRLPAFHDAPAVVAAALDVIEHLPQLPTHIADPQVARLPIEAHPPRVAKAVRPNLAARAFQIDERIVGWNAVVLSVVGVIDVDPQNARQQVADVLPGASRVRWVRPGAVSRGNIQTAVEAKLQTATVMTAGEPGDDRGFAGRVDGRWVGVRHAKSRDVRSIVEIRSLDVANIAVPVLREVGMKREGIDGLYTLDRFAEVNHQVGLLHVGIVRKRKDLARLLNNEQPVAARCVGQIKTILELEFRKGVLGHIGVWHFGRPRDSRGGPCHPLLNAHLRRISQCAVSRCRENQRN